MAYVKTSSNSMTGKAATIDAQGLLLLMAIEVGSELRWGNSSSSSEPAARVIAPSLDAGVFIFLSVFVTCVSMPVSCVVCALGVGRRGMFVGRDTACAPSVIPPRALVTGCLARSSTRVAQTSKQAQSLKRLTSRGSRAWGVGLGGRGREAAPGRRGRGTCVQLSSSCRMRRCCGHP